MTQPQIPNPTAPIVERDRTPTLIFLQFLRRLLTEPYTGREQQADPEDPMEGQFVMWMSDGTDSGDDGDILVKITAGGVTKTTTLLDFSTL